MSIPAEHMARIQAVVGEPEPPAAPPVAEVPEEAPLTQQDLELARQTARAEALEQALRHRAEPREPREDTPPPPEPKWEEMTTKDIVELVVREVRNGDAATRKAVGEELLKLRLESQILKAQEDHADFMDYADDVVRISQEKGGMLTPEEAYLLAKSRRAAGANARRAAVPTGGQRPGTRGATPPKAPANMREAASRAFEEVFGRKAR